MDSLAQDVRYSLRSLAKQPVFVVVAVLSLALGIGVNTAIFSVLNSVLLKPLPLQDPDRSVFIYHTSPDNPDRGTSFPAYQYYRARTETFSNVMAFAGTRPLSLNDGDRRDQIYAELVSASYFSMTNINVRLGQGFGREVDQSSDPQFVAVLSHSFWQRRFAADANIVGKTVILNGEPFTVIGIAAEGFTGLDHGVSTDVWIPMSTWAHLISEPQRLTSDEHWITTVGLLRQDVKLEQAQAAMAVAGQAMVKSPGQQTRVRSVREMFAGNVPVDVLATGAAVFGVGLLVLTLACTNVANLLIARAAVRQKEISVRVALGATRMRVLRLGLTESLLLCLTAGGFSILIASWFLDLIMTFKPPTFIGQSEAPTLALGFHIDLRVFAFTLGLSILCATLVGLLSSLPGSSALVIGSMKTDRVTDRRFAPGFNVRSVVIALQMALSLLLLIPCGLFIRSWLNASTISPGFSTDHVLLLPISTEQAGVRVQKPQGFDQQLMERVAALPGVEVATLTDPVPLWFGDSFARYLIESGRASGESQRMARASVAPGYFETLRIPLLRGRDFTRADNASAPRVAIINETMARRFWPDGDVIGQRINDGDGPIEIVGVARDTKYSSLAGSSEPFLYQSIAQSTTNNLSLSLAVRTTGDPMQLQDPIAREVKALIPTWPAFQFRTLDEGLQLQRLVPRLSATLLGVLGIFGLLLAAIGVYGVMAYVVKQRTREIGIRLALGASNSGVIRLVIRQGMLVCVIGAAVGLGAALAVTSLLGSFLYGVSSVDPLTYLAVLLLLFSVAFLACYLPARRVTKVNTLEVLHYE